jgi:hypothetical protein
MTVLKNAIHMAASPKDVWAVLAELGALDEYDPGVKRSEVVSPIGEGSGAVRRCELRAGGWLQERVTDWEPGRSLAFELSECSLPVKSLRYRYTLEPDERGTLVSQRMEYRLKFGPIGKLMDALMVRRKWDAGIKTFFVGLKGRVESPDRAKGA